METFVKSEIKVGVGRITLNRPDKRNALRRDFIEQLTAAVSEMKSDDTLRVLVMQAKGTVFCAGMDLSQMQDRAQSSNGKLEWQKDSEVYCDLLTELYSIEVPTVVALQGPVLAGGVGIVLACDIVIASDTAFLMLPEPVRGITAAMVTPLLIHRVGAGIAGHLLLSGERMSAQRGWQTGLCHDVVEANQLTDRVESLTQSILSGSKSALSLTKLHLGRCSNDTLVKQIQDSVQVSAEARESSDAREGLAAFLEKRKPTWQSS
jgi:methylglutaconyl-CoA hydratase